MGSKSEKTDRPGEAAATAAEDSILVAVVIRPHALRGAVRIEVHSDVAGRFEPGGELWLTEHGNAPRKVRIASFRPVRGGGVIRFEGVESCEQADSLRGARLEVPRSVVPAAPEGLYYHFELIGCRCIDAEHGDLGKVASVLEDGGGFLLEVKNTERTVLVPFVEAFLETVDVARQEIRLHLPEGLIEACASRS